MKVVIFKKNFCIFRGWNLFYPDAHTSYPLYPATIWRLSVLSGHYFPITRTLQKGHCELLGHHNKIIRISKRLSALWGDHKRGNIIRTGICPRITVTINRFSGRHRKIALVIRRLKKGYTDYPGYPHSSRYYR